jgi:hypothetical protein
MCVTVRWFWLSQVYVCTHMCDSRWPLCCRYYYLSDGLFVPFCWVLALSRINRKQLLLLCPTERAVKACQDTASRLVSVLLSLGGFPSMDAAVLWGQGCCCWGRVGSGSSFRMRSIPLGAVVFASSCVLSQA